MALPRKLLLHKNPYLWLVSTALARRRQRAENSPLSPPPPGPTAALTISCRAPDPLQQHKFHEYPSYAWSIAMFLSTPVWFIAQDQFKRHYWEFHEPAPLPVTFESAFPPSDFPGGAAR